ncbi:MAG: TonB-dependent receptor domain-containing protein, partial [Ktedonobacterales bacterium]
MASGFQPRLKAGQCLAVIRRRKVSLRGLGSTSASRTLVTDDDVPLNDPIGGWIHWQEQPELALQSVELVRGGTSDL